MNQDDRVWMVLTVGEGKKLAGQHSC